MLTLILSIDLLYLISALQSTINATLPFPKIVAPEIANTFVK